MWIAGVSEGSGFAPLAGVTEKDHKVRPTTKWRPYKPDDYGNPWQWAANSLEQMIYTDQIS